MAAAHLSLTRRALLAGACSVPVLRHSGLDPEPTLPLAAQGKERWMPHQVRHDEEWQKALARFHAADTALAAAAHTADEALYDRLGDRHYRALQRLLTTPAPTIAALAQKLDLALYDAAQEFLGDEAAMRALKQDARRLAAAAA
jgi:hypothetical protein